MPDMKLVELMCSRLCHDLVGATGAVANGIELIQEEDTQQLREQAMQLLEASAREASAKLQFYRLAFGFSGGPAALISLADVRELTAGLYRQGRVKLDWEIGEEGREGLSRDVAKLLTNILLIAAGSLPRGGVLKVRCETAPAAWQFEIAANGAVARLPDGVAQVLDGSLGADELEAAVVQPYYARSLAENLGIALNMSSDLGESFTLTFQAPRKT